MPEPTAGLNPGHKPPPKFIPLRATAVRSHARLSVEALCERLSLLAHIGLPCMVFLSSPDMGQLFMGPIRRCARENTQIVIEGDQFSLNLEEQAMGEIYLADQDSDAQTGAAVELYDRAGRLITRICGLPDPVIGAVWQDLMDSFAHSAL